MNQGSTRGSQSVVASTIVAFPSAKVALGRADLWWDGNVLMRGDSAQPPAANYRLPNTGYRAPNASVRFFVRSRKVLSRSSQIECFTHARIDQG